MVSLNTGYLKSIEGILKILEIVSMCKHNVKLNLICQLETDVFLFCTLCGTCILIDITTRFTCTPPFPAKARRRSGLPDLNFFPC